MKNKNQLTKNKTTLIRRSDDNFIDNLVKDFSKNPKSFESLKESLNSPSYNAGQTGATYREINTWSKKGVINPAQEDNGWRKFSFIDNIWVQVVLKLRKFGYPLKNLKKIKDRILEDGSPDYNKFLYYIMITITRRPVEEINFIVTSDGEYEIATYKEFTESKERFNQEEVYDYISINMNPIIQTCINIIDLKPV